MNFFFHLPMLQISLLARENYYNYHFSEYQVNTFWSKRPLKNDFGKNDPLAIITEKSPFVTYDKFISISKHHFSKNIDIILKAQTATKTKIKCATKLLIYLTLYQKKYVK